MLKCTCIIGFALTILGIVAMLLDSYNHKNCRLESCAFGVYPFAGGVGLFLAGIVVVIASHV